MSAGHGSALLYSILHFAGYDLSLDDLKQFRQLDSKTPGHPEYGVTPGVDATTGPLGQGIAMAVGMAMAEANLESRYNTEGNKVIDFNTYVLCGDGDLMEGVSYEAASLAGTLKLNKLIVLYDSNKICLDGETSLTFTDNVSMRFISLGWNVITVSDGENFEAINKAIEEAKNSADRPTLIEINTTIGKHSALEGTNAVHGSPLSKEDISAIKEKLGLRDIPFTLSQNILDDFRYFINKRCHGLSDDFEKKLNSLSDDVREEIEYLMSGDKSIPITEFIYDPPADKCESPRDTSGKILNALALNNPNIMGGSADLFASNKTYIKDGGNFSSSNYLGKNIYFGVREHAMGAILNGLALCNLRTFGSCYLAFSDYLKPSIRNCAMMNLPVTYIFTHDSVLVGKDGATHQPVEQLAMLRSTPNLSVYRPSDYKELIGSWNEILKNAKPSALILPRGHVEVKEFTNPAGIEYGGYIISEVKKSLDVILVTCGSEVDFALELKEELLKNYIEARVVSMPNVGNFLKQDKEYQNEVLPKGYKKIVIEFSNDPTWYRLLESNDEFIGVNTYGKSASEEDVLKELELDLHSLVIRIKNNL